MTGWLTLTDQQRKATIDQALQISGISANAIEKDWWVTLTLKALFQTPYSNYIVFKGGTSLSKCWKLIERFSEDVDIALSPEAFSMSYIENPSQSAVKKLKRTGCLFTSNELKTALEMQMLSLGVPASAFSIVAEPIATTFPDTDPQILYIKYVSLYEPENYIADAVKVEASVRSLSIPYSSVAIQSFLNEFNPNPVYEEMPFLVDAIAPRKTFLEKAFLLHEEFSRPERTKIRSERMSRHLYDLGKIMRTPFGEDALNDFELYSYLIKHREWYHRISWVNYESLSPATISFIPPADVIDVYRQDYALMQEQMIYGDTIAFDDLLVQLQALQSAFRKIKTTLQL